jgi:hypothetical protein
LNRLRQFVVAVEPVDMPRDDAAAVNIFRSRRPHCAAEHGALPRTPLHTGKRLADFETEAGVKRKGAVMKRGLYQPDTGDAALTGPIQNRLHELSAGTSILAFRIDRNRTHAGDDRAFVEAVAADDAASGFRHHAVESGVRKHHGEHADRGFRCGKIRREAVALTDRVECVVADLPAYGRVFRPGGADSHGLGFHV